MTDRTDYKYIELFLEMLFEPFAQKARGKAQQKPKKRKQRANLPE